MPIFKFLAVACPLLVALLFAADAMQAPRGPLFTNNSVGLPRSEPMRAQVQTQAPEQPRAQALAKTATRPAIAAAPALTATPAPRVAETAIAAPEAVTYPEPPTPQTVAAAAPVEPEAPVASMPAAPEAAKTANSPHKRKHAARRHDRSGDTAGYRGPVENGYAYGVRPGEARSERRDWQRRQWSGGDFGQNRWRF